MVEHDQIVSDGARCNQTVDGRTHGQPVSTGSAKEVCGFEENVLAQRRFHDGHSQQGRASDAKGVFVAKPLQNLLNDGQAHRHLVEGNQPFELQGIALAKDLDPD
jgi:hypothetical protein